MEGSSLIEEQSWPFKISQRILWSSGVPYSEQMNQRCNYLFTIKTAMFGERPTQLTKQRIKTRKIIMELHKRNNSCTRLSSGQFNRKTVIGLYASRLYQHRPTSRNCPRFEMRLVSGYRRCLVEVITTGKDTTWY